MIHLLAVPAGKIEAIWPRLDAAYEEACAKSHGILTRESIYSRAMLGVCQVWISADDTTEVTATCVTSTVLFPGGRKAMVVEAIAGSLKTDIFDFRATLEKQAKADGCAAVYFFVSKHQAKHLPGYTMTHIVKCKELA